MAEKKATTADIKKVASELAAEAKAEATKASAAVKKAASTASTAAKKTTSTAKKTTAAKKTTSTAKKTTAAKKTTSTAKKTTAAKKAVKSAAILQVFGNDYKVDEIIASCQKAYKKETKKDAAEIKVYIKPEEGKAYYVVDDNAGSVDL